MLLPFQVSHVDAPETGRVELLAQGLTFDLAGLAPATAAPLPPIAHRYGLDGAFPETPLAALSLTPGEHLRAAANLLLVVRALAGVGASLAALPGVCAVIWNPARSAMAGEGFIRMVSTWLEGGAFPALGLTALVAGPDGGFRSEGLAFFTGQEVHLAPVPGRSQRDSARIMVRLIDALVGTEPVHAPTRFTGPDGEALLAEPSGESGVLHIRSVG